MLTPFQRLGELLRLADDAPESAVRNAIKRARELASDMWSDAFVAMQAPVAWRSWETSAPILSAQAESPGSAIEYPHPVEIVGLFPVIVPAKPNVPAPGLAVPTLDDMLLSVTWDQEQTATAGQDQTSQAGRSSYVTASGLSILTPRLWCIRIESPKPVLSFTWRWKQGPGVFVDSIASVQTFVRPLKRRV